MTSKPATITIDGVEHEIVSTVDYDTPEFRMERLARLHEAARAVVSAWNNLKASARTGDADAAAVDLAIEALSTAAYLAYRHLK